MKHSDRVVKPLLDGASQMASAPVVDLDLLAHAIRDRMSADELSLRAAATKIGTSPATLSRLLDGSKAPNTPDTKTLIQTVSWLGRSLSDFESGRRPSASSMVEVEVHLRALPGLANRDKDALVALVRAAHDTIRTRANTR